MKFNFEMPPAGNPQETESKKDEQSVLERLYKSKPARAVAFAAALFGAGAITESLDSKHPKNEAAIANAVEKDELKLEGLAGKFKTEVQVPGGDQTILHIAQTHENKGLESFDVQSIINSQKHIEQLLMYLKERGIADTVYEEGISVNGLPDIDAMRRLNSDNMVEWLKSTRDLCTDNADQGLLARDIYAVKCELLSRANKLDSNYKRQNRDGRSRNSEVESYIKKLRKDAKEIGEDELIRGDNIYVWGAAIKMYCEGKIKIKGASSKDADEETDAPYTLKEVIPEILDAGLKPKFRHSIREGAALDMIAKDAPTLKEKIIPLVYGAGHNFTSAVKDWDKKAGANKFGLTRVEAK